MNIKIGEKENDIECCQSRDRTCKREGWDDEGKKFELCGSGFTESGCICHPDYCLECSAETHNISLTLPGVIEQSPIEHDCSAKGNY